MLYDIGALLGAYIYMRGAGLAADIAESSLCCLFTFANNILIEEPSSRSSRQPHSCGKSLRPSLLSAQLIAHVPRCLALPLRVQSLPHPLHLHQHLDSPCASSSPEHRSSNATARFIYCKKAPPPKQRTLAKCPSSRHSPSRRACALFSGQ